MTTSRPTRRRNVWVLAADSGCGACAQTIQALQAPRYAALLHAHGIRFARSPRHADVVLLTGGLSERARGPLGRMLAAVPEPRALVAVGDCAISGCVFRGSPTLTANPAEALDVNVEIAGCPPAPAAILEAIVAASDLLTHAPAQQSEESDSSAGHDDNTTVPVPREADDAAKPVTGSTTTTNSADSAPRQTARRGAKRQGGSR